MNRQRSAIFFFNDTATTEIYTLSLHDALPIFLARGRLGRAALVGGPSQVGEVRDRSCGVEVGRHGHDGARKTPSPHQAHADRKSTRLNSIHANISYAVFCLKKKIMHKRKYILV